LLTPIGLPFWEIPLITILELRAGNGLNNVMVLPARELSAKAKITESRTLVPLSIVPCMACLKVPEPLSALEVTINVSAKE